MDSVQAVHVSELSHHNVRNSVCSDWLLQAWSTMIGEGGAAHPDKALFSRSRIYLGGKDKGDSQGWNSVLNGASPELSGKVQAKCHHHVTQTRRP